jgi:hypothetical protein
MTLEAWVRPSALGNLRSVVMKERPGSFDYALFADNASNAPAANVFTTTAFQTSGPAAIGLGTWTYLAQTWDGTTLRLYVDGAEVANKPAPGALVTSTGDLRIGGSSAGSQFFSGLIDEVRVFSRARTSAEIAADMNAPVDP